MPENQKRSLPSFVWIILILGGIAALIAILLGGLIALSTIEGIASILLLGIAWVAIRAGNHSAPTKQRTQTDSFGIGLGIAFFALMGLAIDQPGNYLYNRPLQWLFCPANTELVREAEIRHPRDGTTQIIQDFQCVDDDQRSIRQISVVEMLAVRFSEYVLIGYLLVWANQLYTRLRSRSSGESTA